jgi:hypothetical protein
VRTLVQILSPGLSLPNFWIAILLIIGASTLFGWLPALIYVPLVGPVGEPPADVPARAVLVLGSAVVVHDPVVDARGWGRLIRSPAPRGWPRGRFSDTRRNALVPIVTVLGLQMGSSGGVITSRSSGCRPLDPPQRGVPAGLSVAGDRDGVRRHVRYGEPLVDLLYTYLDRGSAMRRAAPGRRHPAARPGTGARCDFPTLAGTPVALIGAVLVGIVSWRCRAVSRHRRRPDAAAAGARTSSAPTSSGG